MTNHDSISSNFSLSRFLNVASEVEIEPSTTDINTIPTFNSVIPAKF